MFPEGWDMASNYPNGILGHLRRLAGSRQSDHLSDGRLLERFALGRDETAFAALLERHGPMVLGVCRRLLRNAADADDAFQATFLVLVSRAGTVARRDSVGSWLYGVAYRTACRARERDARRRGVAWPAADLPAPGATDPAAEASGQELQVVLDEEVQHLPEKYRVPLVLCCFEGRTNAEAAGLLGWPLGTVQVRLHRGRELLRSRLVRRGVTLSAGLVAVSLLPDASAMVPAALASATLRAAVLFAAGRATEAVPAPVAALTTGVLRTMRLARLKTLTAALALVAALGILAGVLTQHVLAGRGAPIGEGPAAATPEPESAAGSHPGPEVSKAWYVLRQSNTFGLFHGMPVRLARAVVPSRRTGPLWTGVEDGGRLQLDIAVEDGVSGEVFVGFFTGPTWSAEPVQARRFPGPGRYTVDRLPPGEYHLGAMIGLPPHPAALGVHRQWPAPIEIRAGETTRAQLRLSPEFKDNPAGHGSNPKKGYAGQWDRMDPARLITVRTVDDKGKPVPFCHVTFATRGRKKPDQFEKFFDTGTDDRGYAYCDQIDGAFSLLMVQRFEIVPETLAFRFETRRLPTVYQAVERPFITIPWDPCPTGTGKVTGRVRDHRGRPVKEFYVEVQREEGNRQGTGEYRSLAYQVPVIDAGGRYEVGGLPPGAYQVTAFAFDIGAYSWSFEGSPFTLANDNPKPAQVDLELEAKELYYGRAVYADGTPVYPGIAVAWLEKYSQEQINRHHGEIGRQTNSGLERDGSFRIALLRKEHEDLVKNTHGVVEIEWYGREDKDFQTGKVGEVLLDRLSRDPAHPAEFVFPRKEGNAPRKADGGATTLPRGDARSVSLELLDTDGRTRSLADYAGKPILLNVFTTWCGPCQEELPHLLELHRRCADRGLVVLAVSRGEEPDVVEAYARRQRLPFPILVDPGGKTLAEFKDRDGRRVVPTNVLLDREHHVLFADTGYTAEKFARLREAVEQVLVSGPQK
jgi:RNA polymerase sigma factor (sigma-70 family)